MPSYIIEPAVFQMFPGFRRGVVVATGINNREGDPETARLLADAAGRVSAIPTSDEQDRIAAWDAAYLKFGADPKKHTPSVRFLYQQIRKGKPPRSINSAVDVMNSISIGWTLPCGGDDLASLTDGDSVGDIRLGLARGDETFAPLFKPAAVEHPDPGEIIYYTLPARRVMCRRWTWRNADFSKITTATQNLAINVDLLSPPFEESQLGAPLARLQELMRKHCGGQTAAYVLSPENPAIQW
jgi:DNA/RNA-binding domain of Phe-tRNA-synthetase-like protein